MLKNLKLRVLSYVVIAYMLLAFGWWSILLFQKNEDAFKAKTELLKLVEAAQQNATNIADFEQLPSYISLEKKYTRQRYMIFGEALVFIISLVIGIWLINRAYHKEIMIAQQRRNFLLSITHELKSPLSSIRLVLETFMKRNLDKSQFEKLATNALNDTERLNELINNLLMAAKIETAYQPHFEKVQLDELLQDTIERLRSKYPHVDFQYKQNAMSAAINADKVGIISIVLNLLENAVKYSTDTKQVITELTNNNGVIQMQVKDLGIGISDKDKKYIFNRFYRVGNEDTRKTKGTGLGLYIVKQIIKAHHGDIRVKDNQPRGTIFEVKIPTA